MANTPIEFFAPSGLAITVKLYAQSAPDVEAASVLALEYTNAKGYFVVTIAAALVGNYNARLTLADGTTIGGFEITLADTVTVHRPSQQNPPVRSNVWTWLDVAVALRFSTRKVWNGLSWMDQIIANLPVVSSDVAYDAGYPASVFVHEEPDGTITKHAHVHGLTAGALAEIATATGTGAQLEADVEIDYSVTPALVIWYEKGTENEIMRKAAYDRNGAPITSKLQQLGKLVHVDSP